MRELEPVGDPLRTSLRRKVIASYLGSGWSALVGLACVPLYVHYLGIESYGLIGLFVSLQVWLSVLDMGLPATLSRELAQFTGRAGQIQNIRDLLRSMEVVTGVVALLLAVSIALLSPLIASYWLQASALSAHSVAQSMALMGVVIGFQWVGTLYRGGLVGLQRQEWLSAVMAISATLRGVGSVIVLVWSPTISAFFAFQAVVSAAEAGTFAWQLHRRLPQPPARSRFTAGALKQVWRFAGGLTVISLQATFLTQFDKILLSKLLPLDQFGYFMLAAAVAGALSIFVVPLHNVAYPRFSELVASGNQKALADEYHKFSQILSTCMLPLSLMLVFFAQDILLLWTRDAVVATAVAPLLTVLVLGTTLNGLTHVPTMAQIAHGWTRLAVVMSASMVAVSVPLLLLLVPRYGALVAAWIWFGVNAAYLVFAVPVMHSRILRGEKWAWYTRDVLAPAGAGALAAAATKVLFTDARGDTPPVYLLFAGLLVTLAVGLSTQIGRETSASVARQLFRRQLH